MKTDPIALAQKIIREKAEGEWYPTVQKTQQEAYDAFPALVEELENLRAVMNACQRTGTVNE